MQQDNLIAISIHWTKPLISAIDNEEEVSDYNWYGSPPAIPHVGDILDRYPVPDDGVHYYKVKEVMYSFQSDDSGRQYQEVVIFAESLDEAIL